MTSRRKLKKESERNQKGILEKNVKLVEPGEKKEGSKRGVLHGGGKRGVIGAFGGGGGASKSSQDYKDGTRDGSPWTGK